MNYRLLLRIAKLVRRPPSRQQQIIVAVVLAAAAMIWGYEALFGWPEWATVNSSPRGRLKFP